MGVDFHWIGTTISSGSSHNGFSKIVSFPSVAGFPAYGTEISRAYNTPYSAGSIMVTVNGVNYYSQFADFVTYADGAGGTFTAWENINTYGYNGVPFATYNYTSPYPQTSYYDFGGYIGGQYTQYYTQDFYFHDGSGSYTVEHPNLNYYSYGTFIAQSSTAETMMYNGTSGPVPTGRNELVDYKWDGSGGYFTAFAGYSGSYYPYGTVVEYGFTNMNNTQYINGSYYDDGTYTNTDAWIHNGSGSIIQGSVSGLGSYYAYGTYITSDGMYNYYWNGSGGYYTENI